MENEVFLFRSWRLVFLYLSCFIVLVLSSVEENLLTGDKDLIEGDMKLTLDQKLELLTGSGEQKVFKATKLWPGGIVTYDIDTSLAHDMKALFAIWLAMKEFERKTCIRFQKRKNENEHIWFYRGVGCWTHVGKTGLKQSISLAPDCCFYGIVVHEIAHSLGCFHEHSRLDRDKYVTIEWRNIMEGWGKIKHPGSSHIILQQAKIPPVNNTACAAKLANSSGAGSLRITPEMLCAGEKGLNVGGCHGDSGGPYVCQESNKRWVFQGIVSWGSPQCSALERYTVFARVAKFRKWIDDFVN